MIIKLTLSLNVIRDRNGFFGLSSCGESELGGWKLWKLNIQIRNIDFLSKLIFISLNLSE